MAAKSRGLRPAACRCELPAIRRGRVTPKSARLCFLFCVSGEERNPAIAATKWSRALSWPPWSLRLCDGSFVLLSSVKWMLCDPHLHCEARLRTASSADKERGAKLLRAQSQNGSCELNFRDRLRDTKRQHQQIFVFWKGVREGGRNWANITSQNVSCFVGKSMTIEC